MLVFNLIVDHVLGAPGGGVAAQPLMEPLEVGVVVDWHRTHVARPMAIVAEDDETTGHTQGLQGIEVLQALCIAHTVVTLAGENERRSREILD